MYVYSQVVKLFLCESCTNTSICVYLFVCPHLLFFLFADNLLLAHCRSQDVDQEKHAQDRAYRCGNECHFVTTVHAVAAAGPGLFWVFAQGSVGGELRFAVVVFHLQRFRNWSKLIILQSQSERLPKSLTILTFTYNYYRIIFHVELPNRTYAIDYDNISIPDLPVEMIHSGSDINFSQCHTVTDRAAHNVELNMNDVDALW